MPTYVYRCEQCGSVVERRQRFEDPPLTECEACRGSLRRVLQPVSVVFRGSGFYSTDYRSKAAGAADGQAEKTPTTSGAESSESTKSATSAEPSKPTAPVAAASPSKDD